jgi:hypothetical protein
VTKAGFSRSLVAREAGARHPMNAFVTGVLREASRAGHLPALDAIGDRA